MFRTSLAPIKRIHPQKLAVPLKGKILTKPKIIVMIPREKKSIRSEDGALVARKLDRVPLHKINLLRNRQAAGNIKLTY